MPALRRHQRDHRVLALGLELVRVRVGQLADVARELDDRGLQAEADAEERQPCSRAQRIASSMPSTPRTPKPPGTSRPSYGAEQLAGRGLLVGEPVARRSSRSRTPDVVGDAAVDQRLVDRLVGVGELGVLADHRDPHLARCGLQDLARTIAAQVRRSGSLVSRLQPAADFARRGPARELSGTS